ncbi:putative transposase [Methylomagnum ishizawai]|uniref:Putative transposase n=1 Tax=Methylomagnum ishizawai TaxID=1760988 RepID=A0A1Y6D1X4_9GAMM|nr:putative transposase [Methylomagnum ishizawai]
MAEKKVRDRPLGERRDWIDKGGPLAPGRQCALAGVSRSFLYAPRRAAEPDREELELLALIDAEYTRHPFYGSRKMTAYLRGLGHRVNRKRVQRLMRKLGLAGMAPGPNTSRPHPRHKVYPYLLRGLEIDHPNQVWSTDITYVRLPHGFVYLVAVIDWYSRKVLAWRVSNTLDGGFCVDCLEQAIRAYGTPGIFNSDQGCQFTSEAFTGALKAHGVAISMDGRGRALDNIFVERLWRSVKHEDVYLRGYGSLPELLVGLTNYFGFYNAERSHQSLGYRTPDEVYRTAVGGGARIVDKFGGKKAAPSKSAEAEPGQRRSAASDPLPS